MSSAAVPSAAGRAARQRGCALSPLEWTLLAATPLVPWLGLVPGLAWAVPLLAPLTLWRPFARRVRADAIGGAWRIAMLWAVLLAVGVMVLVLAQPGPARAAIIHGETYKAEMFPWIATGEGRESDPARFVPQHLLHLGAFLILTLVSGGYLGLALGAALLDYMAYFVASYALASHNAAALLLAWVPWSVVRIAAFVLLGALASRPLLVHGFEPPDRRHLRLALIGVAGLLVDVVLKAALAPTYAGFLRTLARGAGLPI